MHIEIPDLPDPNDQKIVDLTLKLSDLAAERQRIWLMHVRSGYNGGETPDSFFERTGSVVTKAHDWRQAVPLAPFGLVCAKCGKRVMDPFGAGKAEREKHDCNTSTQKNGNGHEAVERLSFLSGEITRTVTKIDKLKKEKQERIYRGLMNRAGLDLKDTKKAEDVWKNR